MRIFTQGIRAEHVRQFRRAPFEGGNGIPALRSGAWALLGRDTQRPQMRANAVSPHALTDWDQRGTTLAVAGNMDPFLIFSLKRCGSTTLMRLLNTLPGMRCMREPFNRDNYGSKYHDRVSDAESLRDVLHELWSTHDGIKHVWESDGWPFRRPDLNARLALEPGQRVVFLRRRNVLQRIVSLKISEQSDVWSTIPVVDRQRLAAFEFRPLDTSVVRRYVSSEMRMLDALRQRMVDADVVLMDVWYEDLYDLSASAEVRRSRFESVVEFLGRSIVADDATIERIERLLDPSVTRLNSAESYSRIPGIREVEARCGGDETGWLFR